MTYLLLAVLAAIALGALFGLGKNTVFTKPHTMSDAMIERTIMLSQRIAENSAVGSKAWSESSAKLTAALNEKRRRAGMPPIGTSNKAGSDERVRDQQNDIECYLLASQRAWRTNNREGMAVLIKERSFGKALEEAVGMSDDMLKLTTKSGTSRSYYVRYQSRIFPMKAILRLAYIREGIDWDGPQSKAAAQFLRPHFTVLHVTEKTESKRLERQRQNVERWQRDGQFREKVLDLYDLTCAVTGCSALDAIDAAHILGVGTANDDTAENGIVLRADLHRLFDAAPPLMAINPKGLTVHFSEECRDHYQAYAGRVASIPDDGPKGKAFSERWKAFRRAEKLRGRA